MKRAWGSHESNGILKKIGYRHMTTSNLLEKKFKEAFAKLDERKQKKSTVNYFINEVKVPMEDE